MPGRPASTVLGRWSWWSTVGSEGTPGLAPRSPPTPVPPPVARRVPYQGPGPPIRMGLAAPREEQGRSFRDRPHPQGQAGKRSDCPFFLPGRVLKCLPLHLPVGRRAGQVVHPDGHAECRAVALLPSQHPGRARCSRNSNQAHAQTCKFAVPWELRCSRPSMPSSSSWGPLASFPHTWM